MAEYSDTTPVLFVDAFDVLFAQPASVLLREFHALRQGLVFSAEKGCWPYLDGTHTYESHRITSARERMDARKRLTCILFVCCS